MSENDHDSRDNCIFCRIVSKLETNTEILYEDDNYVIIRDHRPVVSHHYLLITKKHIKNAKQLKSKEDIEMIKQMKDISIQFMTDTGLTDDKEMRMGFHWPPFNTISHLHLHILYPISQMSFVSRLIFRSGSYWFFEINDLIEWLSKKQALV